MDDTRLPLYRALEGTKLLFFVVLATERGFDFGRTVIMPAIQKFLVGPTLTFQGK